MQNPSTSSLRKQVLEGGIYLTIRRGLGLVLGLIGLLFLTRIVGPSAYGLYNSAFGFFSYVLALGQMGINVYLIRLQSEEAEERFHLAFWWLAGSGVALTLAIAGVLLVLGKFWVRTEGFILITLALCATLPFLMISVVPQSYLERQLKYKAVTTVEMLSQLLYYIVAIPLAMRGLKEWALTWGFLASQVVLVGGLWWASGYRPVRYWDWATLKDMLHYSFGQALSGWIYNLRNLGPSMILLPLAGKEAVGYFALATRLMTTLTFVSEAIGRITVPALAKIQHDRAKLSSVVGEGMALRLLSVCSLLVLFLVVSPWILPRLLGNRWEIGTLLVVFSLIAIQGLISATSGIMASALHLVRRNRAMIAVNIAYITTFLTVGTLLTWFLPSAYKLYGYALADLIARVPNFWLIDRNFREAIGTPDYRLTLLWGSGFIALMFAPVFGWWLYLVALPFFVNRTSRSALQMWWKQIRQLKHSYSPSTPPKEGEESPKSVDLS